MLKQICAQSGIAAAACLLVAPAFAWAQDLTDVDDIVRRANHMAYYQGADGRAQVKMTITDAQNRTRTKEFTILRRDMDADDDGDQKFYVYFHLPPDERGTVFMVWKHVGQDDDRWLYLPALDVTRRIAASDERTSFVGSHFFYEDVSGRGIEEDDHELIDTTAQYYVVKSTPKNPRSIEFDSFTNWIHKGTFLPVKTSYEKGGTEYRTYEVLAVEEIQGYRTVTRSRMTDNNIGGNTVIEYSEVEFDLGLPDDIFTERYLRNAPREHLPR